jgi:hypothetical protein
MGAIRLGSGKQPARPAGRPAPVRWLTDQQMATRRSATARIGAALPRAIYSIFSQALPAFPPGDAHPVMHHFPTVAGIVHWNPSPSGKDSVGLFRT